MDFTCLFKTSTLCPKLLSVSILLTLPFCCLVGLFPFSFQVLFCLNNWQAVCSFFEADAIFRLACACLCVFLAFLPLNLLHLFSFCWFLALAVNSGVALTTSDSHMLTQNKTYSAHCYVPWKMQYFRTFLQRASPLIILFPPLCFVFLAVPVNCCLWLLQRRVGGPAKGVEGEVEMESTGDEQCCAHHHHHMEHHPHHQHHHRLHEDSLGSDSSLGAQSDLSEDSTQVRLRLCSLHVNSPMYIHIFHLVFLVDYAGFYSYKYTR